MVTRLGNARHCITYYNYRRTITIMTDEQVLTLDTEEQPEVTEVKVEAPKTKNPHLTVVVDIHGLDPYRVTGLRANVLKTARNWIRQRGLSVQLEGVDMKEDADLGDEIDVDGNIVKADLRTYIFSESCILTAEAIVTAPRPKTAPKSADASAPKVGGEAKAKGKSKAKAKETVEPVEPLPEDSTPNDW